MLRLTRTLLSVALLCSATLASVAFAQNPAGTIPLIDSTVYPHRPFDVQAYNLLLDWRNVLTNQTHIFHGVNQIDLVLTDTTSRIELDAMEMQIDSVAVNGAQITPTPVADGNGKLFIPLVGPLRNNGTSIHLRIAYTRNSQNDDGLYFYPKHLFVGLGPKGDSVFVEENLAFTMSEPLDARKWMPCMDLPFDKANSAISIIVPDGYSAQSNGLLQSIDTNADRSLTFHWKSDRPIATYLMVADASKFVSWSDYYHRVSNPNDSVRTLYFAWASDYNQTSDTSGNRYNAQWALRNTPKMLAAFSKRFGEYPFAQYGQVPAQPFYFGGMEHQTMTTINRVWFRGKDEDGIAHELFHQWFGDKTTCATWADIWLNEGFATFGEAIWEEEIRGHDAYLASLYAKANGFFYPQGGPNTIPIYNPPVDNIFNTATTYYKPGCVLHMLRRFVDNDTMFFNTLKDYSAAFAYSAATTEQFANFVQARIGSNFTIAPADFIREWIYGYDYPKYSVTWTQNAQHELVIKVDQQQDSTDHYKMPLRFHTITSSGVKDIVLLDTLRSQTFNLPLDHRVDSIAFDDDAVMISTHEISGSSDAGVALAANAAERIGVSYERGYTKLSFPPVTESSVSLSIVDAVGRTVGVHPLAEGATSLRIDHVELASGNYLASMPDGHGGMLTAKIHLLR